MRLERPYVGEGRGNRGLGIYTFRLGRGFRVGQKWNPISGDPSESSGVTSQISSLGPLCRVEMIRCTGCVLNRFCSKFECPNGTCEVGEEVSFMRLFYGYLLTCNQSEATFSSTSFESMFRFEPQYMGTIMRHVPFGVAVESEIVSSWCCRFGIQGHGSKVETRRFEESGANQEVRCPLIGGLGI